MFNLEHPQLLLAIVLLFLGMESVIYLFIVI